VFTDIISNAGGQLNPCQSSHGWDFDAVAYDKPSQNIQLVDCDVDGFGQESLKYENSKNISHVRTIIRQYVTLAQDYTDNYAMVENISFTDCITYAPIGLAYLKRQHIPAGGTVSTNPAATLTLGSADPGTGIAVTASAGVFAAPDVGKSIGAVSGNIAGFAIITGYTSATQVTVTIVNQFATTSVASGWNLCSSNNSGAGNITFTRTLFSGDDAYINGADNSAVNYGVITLDSNTFTGRNSFVAPSGVSPVLIGTNVGLSRTITVWCGTSGPSIKTISVSGTGIGFSTTKSSPTSSAGGPVAAFALREKNGYNFTDARLTFTNGTYTSSYYSAFNPGAVDLRFSVESESLYGAIIDGTGVNSSFFAWNTANTRLVTLSGFYIMNFIGGTSSRGLVFNAANAVGRIYNNYFYNCSTTANGGSGVRVQVAQLAIIEYNIFDSLTTSGAGNGVCILANYVNTIIRSNLVKNCIAPGTSSSMFYLQANAAGETWATGNVFVNNTGVGNIGIGVSTSQAGSIFNVYNNSSYSPGAIAANLDYSFFQGAAGVTVNFFNNIGYSPTMTLNVSKTTNGTFNHGDNCTRVAISATGGTNNNLGGNILTDPLFTSLNTLTISTNSPAYRTGYLFSSALQAMVRDKNRRPFNVPSSIGAYSIDTNGGVDAIPTR